MPDKASKESFVDYYEHLQLSPNADFETIERVYRLLAKRYHPDNNHTGNVAKFRLLTEAYRVLSDAEKRAAYDVNYEKARARQWNIFVGASSSEGAEADRRIQQAILSLLYISRRQDAWNPGIGTLELQRLIGCPEQHMEFHAWYLREKGWIHRTDNGMFAITASGVDAVTENGVLLRKDRLLPAAEESSSKSEKSKGLDIRE